MARRIQGLDGVDLRIIAALERDARQSFAEIGRKIGLSQPAVSERVKRLEDRGVIAGYRAVIDPRALGFRTMAILRLRTTHDQIGPCLARFRANPNIIEVHRITGEDCISDQGAGHRTGRVGDDRRSDCRLRCGDHVRRIAQ